MKWPACMVLISALAVGQSATNPLARGAGGKARFEGSAGGQQHRKMTRGDVERLAKELSNWGRWGAKDELGAVNLITPAKRIEAAALVKLGLPVSVAINDSTERAADNNQPFGHKMLTTGADPSALFALDEYTCAFHNLYMTHLDALCHAFNGQALYNGFPRMSVTAAGAQKLDVTKLKNGVFTRGVLFDIPRLKGRAYLEPGDPIYPEDLDLWEKKAGVAVQPGDAVLIRTGRWARRAKLGPISGRGAGLDVTCARWLHQHDVAVLGSDNYSDVVPSGIDGMPMPVHLLAINSMGMPILDNCNLEELAEVAAKQHRWVFLLTFAPEPVPGGTGSPVNPTAIF